MKKYQLTDVQMDRLDPVSEEANPHGGNRVRYYNELDVQLSSCRCSIACDPALPRHYSVLWVAGI